MCVLVDVYKHHLVIHSVLLLDKQGYMGTPHTVVLHKTPECFSRSTCYHFFISKLKATLFE